MSFYDSRDSYGHYSGNNYQSDSRRNSNSFSEEHTGVKRKRTNRSGRGRRGSRNFNRGGNRNVNSVSKQNITIDTPIFKEPLTPPPRSTPTSIDQRRRGNKRDNPFRTSYREPSPQPYFDMRDMPDFVEPQHTGTPWHWENYFHGCKSWQEKHKLAYYRSRCMALEFENQMLFEQINKLIEENCVFAAERGKVPTMHVPDISGRQGWQAERATSAQTTPKKQERSRSGANAKSVDNKTGENQGQKVPMGQKRKEELEQLYGENSSLIHGLETSIELSFNRNCDSCKPQLYPTIPLNLKEAEVA